MMRNLRGILPRCVLLLAAFALAGGHWAALQSIAWTGMLFAYSKDAGFIQGVEKTFSGEAPCPLCEKIAQGREYEESQKTGDRAMPEALKAALTQPATLPFRHSLPAPPPVAPSDFLSHWRAEIDPPPPRRA